MMENGVLLRRVIREHVPEGLAIIYEAPQRRGKTLGGVMFSLDAHQCGRNVFSNIQLGFPHSPLQFSEIKLEDSPVVDLARGALPVASSPYWNGHIFIDELNFYFDARRSMTDENITFGNFLLQQKKQGCNLTGTTHDLYSLDLRIRDHYDYLVTPTVYPAYPAVPEVIKLVVTNGPLQPRKNKTLILDARPYLGLYDSFAVYDPFKARNAKRGGFRARRVEL